MGFASIEIEAYASGDAFDEESDWTAILDMEILCCEARNVVDGIQHAVISPEDAQ